MLFEDILNDFKPRFGFIPFKGTKQKALEFQALFLSPHFCDI
jgi:hypothetical protein